MKIRFNTTMFGSAFKLKYEDKIYDADFCYDVEATNSNSKADEAFKFNSLDKASKIELRRTFDLMSYKEYLVVKIPLQDVELEEFDTKLRFDIEAELSNEIFHAARMSSDPDDVNSAIARGASVGYCSSVTPLMMAAEYNPNPDIIHSLIDAGAEVDAPGPANETPLMFAAWGNSNENVLLALINRGANVNMRDSNDRTALHHAAKCNESIYVLETLISAGAGVNAVDANLQTPLMDACQYSTNYNIIDALLAKSSNNTIKRTDESNESALDKYHKNTNLSQNSETYEKLKNAILSLREKQDIEPDINHKLFEAIFNSDDYDFIQDIIDRGADVNADDAHGRTPLIKACELTENYAAINVLIDNGADVRFRDHTGDTALDKLKRNPRISKDTETYKRVKAVTEELLS